MGLFSLKAIIFTSVLVVALAVGLKLYSDRSNAIKLKQIEEWAEANKIDVKKPKVDIKPFEIEFDEAEWKKLVAKLDNTRYFDLLDEKYVTRQDFGFDPEYARELVDYWKSKFDWRKQIERLNRFKQFKVNINDTTIHFVNEIVDNKKTETLKIILIDGWPGSFFGFYKMLDYIKTNGNKNFNYDIVVPSIPGYGYSTPLTRPVDTCDTAQLLDALMRYLHGEKVGYYVHGEDWGSIVAATIAKLYPDRVKGIHMTLASSTTKAGDIEHLSLIALSYLAPSLVYSSYELERNITVRASVMKKIEVILKETGYMHLQATRPDTVGHALTDSPVGLMAYVLEKYSSWTFDRQHEILGKKDGGLGKFEKDELLTIITYYWMTNSITSSMRYYKNFFAQMGSGFPKGDILETKMHMRVPTAVQFFRNELALESKALLQLQYPNLKRYTLETEGGHFGGFENPEKSADDFFNFIWSTFEDK